MPWSVRVAPSSTTSTARVVSAWISVISDAIEPAALWDSSASLRTSSATTAKPRPCSPARAASMAAFKANRLVCSAMPVMASTMPPICSDFAPSSRIASVACVLAVADRRHRVGRLAHGLGAVDRDLARRVGGARGLLRDTGGRARGVAPCRPSAAGRSSIALTWRSAPVATSSTALAISPTARPDSRDVVAIWPDAALSVDADCETAPIIVPSPSSDLL